MEARSSDGTPGTADSHTYGVDILTQAIGKPDVRGRVKVAGTGFRRAFGRRDSSQSFRPDVDKIREELSREFEDRLASEVQNRVELELQNRVDLAVQKAMASMFASGMFPSTQAQPSPHTSVSERHISEPRVSPHPPVLPDMDQVYIFSYLT